MRRAGQLSLTLDAFNHDIHSSGVVLLVMVVKHPPPPSLSRGPVGKSA